MTRQNREHHHEIQSLSDSSRRQTVPRRRRRPLAEESDELGIATAKISLIEAVTAAEQHLGGKAASAELKHEGGKWIFEVDVVNGQEVKDVVIDAATGEVLAVQAEKDD